MNVLYQIYEYAKKTVLFFCPIQIVIFIVNIYLVNMSQNIEYLLSVLLFCPNGLIEIMILLLHIVTVIFAVYIIMETELGTFGNYIFIRINKITFMLRKNLILIIYSSAINSILYFIYYNTLNQYNYYLHIDCLWINLLLTYIMYLIMYITALLFKSTQKSVIFLLCIILLMICINVNFKVIFANIIINPIILFVIIILNCILYILIDRYEKPLKKGSD